MNTEALRIVFASHSHMAGPFVVGSHHLARELAHRGHHVAHVSMPVTLFHLMGGSTVNLRLRFGNYFHGGLWREENLFEYVPFAFVPWQLAKYVKSPRSLFSYCFPSVRSVLKRAGFSVVDALIVDAPQMYFAAELLGPRAVIYRATDLYEEMTGDPWVALAERRIAAQSGLLIGTSEPVLAHLRGLAPFTRAILMENGVELNHFSHPTEAPIEYRNSCRARAIYVGAVDARLDIETLKKVASAVKETEVMIVGPLDQAQKKALERESNLLVLGARPYSALPRYLQHASLGLLPLSDHPANRGRSPMKLYEYAAAGLPVVATETEELKRRNLPFVLLARSEDEFVSNVRRLVTDPHLYRSLRDAALMAAVEHSWVALGGQLEQEVQRLLTRDSEPNQTALAARVA